MHNLRKSLETPVFRNVATVLGISGIMILLGLAAKYGNELLEKILADNGASTLFMIFVTAMVVAIILGIVEQFTNWNSKYGRHNKGD